MDGWKDDQVDKLMDDYKMNDNRREISHFYFIGLNDLMGQKWLSRVIGCYTGNNKALVNDGEWSCRILLLCQYICMNITSIEVTFWFHFT